MPDFCPIWDLREKKYQVKGFIQFFTAHHGRGRKFMACKPRKSLISLSASPHRLQGCNTRDIGGSSSSGNVGFCCPVIKGQGLNGDEQGCNEKQGRCCTEWRFLLCWRCCWPCLSQSSQPLPGTFGTRSQPAFRRLGGGEALPFCCLWHDCVRRTNPTFPLFAYLDKQPCFIKG